MLTEREILSVVEMLQNEHLDVRTITLGINLFDCASHDLYTFKQNILKRIYGVAGDLVKICGEVEGKFGIPIVNKRISVSPIAVVGAPFSPSQFVEVAKTLDHAAEHANVDFIGGFSALVEKGTAKGDRALIDAIPQALAETQRVCASVNVVSTKDRKSVV